MDAEEQGCEEVKKEAQRVTKALGVENLEEAPAEDIVRILQTTFEYDDDETSAWITDFERCEVISEEKADTLYDRLDSDEDDDEEDDEEDEDDGDEDGQ